MSLFVTFVRTFGSLLFGAIIFFGFLAFLLTHEIRNHFLDASFYTNALAENDIYNRIYDELLVDPKFDEEARNLLGGFDVPSHDRADIARKIIPPEYLQSQTEASISGIIVYLKGDSADPEVYMDLGPPIRNVKPAIFSYIDQRIDAMEAVPISNLDELAQELEFFLRTLEEGRIPDRVPSLDPIPSFARSQAYNQAFNALKRDPFMSQSAISNLEKREADIKDSLISGDVRKALKLAARPLGEPLIDEAITELREDFDEKDRLDLIANVAEADNKTREEFLEDTQDLRDAIDASTQVGPTLALLVMVLAALSMGLLHLPHWRSALLWLGITLLATGTVFLVVGVVLKTQLRDRLAFNCGDLPDSACEMAIDVYNTVGSTIGSGFLTPSIITMIIGGTLILLPFFVKALRQLWPATEAP